MGVPGGDGLEFDGILRFVLFVEDFVDLAKGAGANFFFNNVLFEYLLAYVGGNVNLQAYYFYFS